MKEKIKILKELEELIKKKKTLLLKVPTPHIYLIKVKKKLQTSLVKNPLRLFQLFYLKERKK